MVKYRKPDHSQTSKRGFKTNRDAERFLASTSVAITEKRYIDPTDARATGDELGKIWIADQEAVLKPSSSHPLKSAWRIHVEPAWGRRQVGDIRHGDVRAWVSELTATRGPTTVIRSWAVHLNAAVLESTEVLSSRVDFASNGGKITQHNVGAEKVASLRRRTNAPVTALYTDSLSHLPLARVADAVVLVNRSRAKAHRFFLRGVHVHRTPW